MSVERLSDLGQPLWVVDFSQPGRRKKRAGEGRGLMVIESNPAQLEPGISRKQLRKLTPCGQDAGNIKDMSLRCAGQDDFWHGKLVEINRLSGLARLTHLRSFTNPL